MTDRERFERAVAMVLAHEGGYINDPADPGGETKYGVSKRSYPHLNIKNLTIEDAKEIYYRDWWLRLRCNEIKDDGVAQKLLDTAVNVGLRTGVRLLQQALVETGQVVTVDGLIGPQTIAAANRAEPGKLLVAMRCEQAAHYRRLIERNPRLAKYERGWINRAYA